VPRLYRAYSFKAGRTKMGEALEGVGLEQIEEGRGKWSGIHWNMVATTQ
jgi:hypothetical protein